MPPLRTIVKGALLLALLAAVAIPPAFAQSAGNASVAVVEVETGAIMGANGIDDLVPANLAGRIGFAILAHEWMDAAGTDPASPLEGGDPNLTVGLALDQILADGRNGEMARALMAARIGYTPALLNGAMEALMAETGVVARDVAVQRGGFGGPEWTGAVSARDTARLAVALTRLHGDGIEDLVAGAGLQCLAIQTGAASGGRWVGVVSGAVSPEGCLSAARSAVGLTDERVATGARFDGTGAQEGLNTDALGLPAVQ